MKKPIKQLKQEGTYREDRHGKNSPPVVALVSPIPLTDAEQKYFDHFANLFYEQKLSTSLDAMAVAMLAQATAEYVVFHHAVKEHGAVTVSKKGSEYLGPHYNGEANAAKRVIDLLKRFGMTPIDRNGLTFEGADEDDAFEKLLKRSRN